MAHPTHFHPAVNSADLRTLQQGRSSLFSSPLREDAENNVPVSWEGSHDRTTTTRRRLADRA